MNIEIKTLRGAIKNYAKQWKSPKGRGAALKIKNSTTQNVDLQGVPRELSKNKGL